MERPAGHDWSNLSSSLGHRRRFRSPQFAIDCSLSPPVDLRRCAVSGDFDISQAHLDGPRTFALAGPDGIFSGKLEACAKPDCAIAKNGSAGTPSVWCDL